MNHRLKSFILVCAALLGNPVSVPAEPAEVRVTGSAQELELRLACSPSSMFEAAQDNEGEVALTLDLIISQMSKINVRIETTLLPRGRGIAEVKNGNLDGLCVCTSDEYLDDFLLHSLPIGLAPFGVIMSEVEREEPLIEVKDPLGIGGRNLGVVRDDGFEEFLKRKQIKNVVLLDTHQQAFKMLELNRIDGFLVRKLSSADQEFARNYKKRFHYRELSRPTLHFCLSGAVGKTIIERVDASLMTATNTM